MAVIRIDDPKAGSEGYTFEIEWCGVASLSNGETRNLSSESAINLCRSEVRTRGERDHDLPNIDISGVSVDTNQGRRDWVAGTFSSHSADSRRGSRYRFNCTVYYNSG